MVIKLGIASVSVFFFHKCDVWQLSSSTDLQRKRYTWCYPPKKYATSLFYNSFFIVICILIDFFNLQFQCNFSAVILVQYSGIVDFSFKMNQYSNCRKHHCHASCLFLEYFCSVKQSPRALGRGKELNIILRFKLFRQSKLRVRTLASCAKLTHFFNSRVDPRFLQAP